MEEEKKGLLSIQRLFEARLVLKTRQARWQCTSTPSYWRRNSGRRVAWAQVFKTPHEFVLQIYLKQKQKQTNKQETLKGPGAVEHSYNSRTLEVKARDQQFKVKLSNEGSSGPAWAMLEPVQKYKNEVLHFSFKESKI